MYRAGLSQPAVVRPAMPILYFGDYQAFARSRLRVVIVGLNPSNAEFPASDPFRRFPEASALAGRPVLEAEDVDRYLDSLNRYFQVAPYARWFDPSFEPLLNGLGASYYGGAATALHTDICTPVPTDPTWSGLGSAQVAIATGGFTLWSDLIACLEPDVVVVSVARKHLTMLGVGEVESWPVAFTVDRAAPYHVRAVRATISTVRPLVVFGRAANTPFGTVSRADKVRIGHAIGGMLDG